MAYHFAYGYGQSTPLPSPLVQAILMHGYLGVQLFFIISGFVILWSAAGRTPAAFVRARLLRLYPEYWIAVVVSTLVFSAIVPGHFRPLPTSEILRNFTMVPQYLGARFVDGVYWTLGVEIKFYVVAWLLILSRQLQHIERWLIGWIVATGLASIVEFGGAVRALLIFPYGALFAAGGLFYLCFDTGWTKRRLATLGLGLAVAAYTGVADMKEFVAPDDITPRSELITVAIFGGMFAIVGLLTWRRPLAQATRAFTMLGALTYPLYLLHNTGKEIFLPPSPADPAPLWRLGVAIAYSLALAFLVMRVGTGPVRRALQRAVDRFPLMRPTTRWEAPPNVREQTGSGT